MIPRELLSLNLTSARWPTQMTQVKLKELSVKTVDESNDH